MKPGSIRKSLGERQRAQHLKSRINSAILHNSSPLLIHVYLKTTRVIGFVLYVGTHNKGNRSGHNQAGVISVQFYD